VPLSTQQALALAAVVKLAGAADAAAAAALPGATISQQAAAANAAAGVHGGGHGGPRHVRTALGSAHYKQPLGALIIPHEHVAHPGHPGEHHGGGEHFIAGEPGHFSHYISQAKWLANQWKGRKHADDAAHSAVESGTHRWVHVGDHEFAVHKGLEVHVPKSTDAHDPVAVKNAPKIFVKHGGDNPEHAVIHPDYTNVLQHGKAAHDLIGSQWKPLPHHEEKAQKSVSFEGKHAAWVPHDWKIHKWANAGPSSTKWAKDTEGAWHFASPGNAFKPASEGAFPEKWLSEGKLVPDDEHPSDHGVHPLEPGVQPGKQEIGGVAVTKEEIHQALAILGADKSTAVKQPLAKAGNPLAAMDYHGVSKAELSKHPELKVTPGSKKAHVGQVKLAVMHHLTAKLQLMSDNQAGEAAAKKTAERIQDEAVHVQALTPHTITVPKEGTSPEQAAQVLEANIKEVPAQEALKAQLKEKLPEFKVKLGETAKLLNPEASSVGEKPPESLTVTGITVNKEEVQAAIDALNASGSTAIKQILKAKGNPLANADYWAVIHEYEAAHPVVKAKGTKQKHAPNAKQMFIAALQEKVASLALADQLIGHDVAAELFDLAKHGTIKPGWVNSSHGALARAAMKAVSADQVAYGWFASNGLGYMSVLAPTNGISFYRVTPQLKAYWHSDDGSKGIEAGGDLAEALKLWVKPKPPGEMWAHEPENAPEPPKPEPPSKVVDEWKKQPGWDKLHTMVGAIKPAYDLHTIPEASAAKSADKALARALWLAWSVDSPRYVQWHVVGWHVGDNAPLDGSYAANSGPWWEVLPDHRVIAHSQDGTTSALSPQTISQILAVGVKPATVLDAPPDPADLVHVTFKGGKVGEFPYGSKVYQDDLGAKTGFKYVKLPDGTWHDSKGKSPFEDAYNTLVANGKFHEVPADKGHIVPVWVQGKHVGDVPAGSKFYTGVGVEGSLGKAYKTVQFPDGTWHTASPSGIEITNYAPQIEPGKGPGVGVFQIPEEAAKGMTEVSIGIHTFWAPRGSAVWEDMLTKYVRHPDGSWTVVDKHDGVVPVDPTSYKTYDSWALGNDPSGVHMTPANAEAHQFLSGNNSSKQLSPEKGIEPVQPAKLADVKVYIGGKHATSFPAGTQVYTAPDVTSAKYAKTPDGKWWWVFTSGPSPADAGNTWDVSVAKDTGHFLEKHDPGTGEPVSSLPPAPAEPSAHSPLPASAVPSAGIPAIYMGQVKGEFPHGSQLYYKAPGAGHYSGLYAKDPSGKWWQVGKTGVSEAPGYKVSDALIGTPDFTSQQPPTPAEVAAAKELTALKEVIQHGTVNPAKAIAGGGGGLYVFFTWHQAALYALASDKDTGDIVIVPGEGGFKSGWVKNATDEHWKIDKGTLATNHYVDGNPSPVSVSELSQAAAQNVVPNSVVVEGKQYLFGYWKKPKSSAFLEIKGAEANTQSYKYTASWKYGTSAHATYFYHAQNGDVKQVTPPYAVKFLQQAALQHSVDKPGAKVVAPKPLSKAAYAKLVTEGEYQVWSDKNGAPSGDHQLTIMNDGSGLLTGPGVLTPHDHEAMGKLITGGGLLDQYGTSVVRPGTPMETYHLFGGVARTRQELEQLKADLEEHWDSSEWTTDVPKFLGTAYLKTYAHKDLVLSFLGDKIDGKVQNNGPGQKKAVYGLVKELLAVPDLPADAKVASASPGEIPAAPKEAAFLKTMPPGIAKASDVFTFTQAGHVLPFAKGGMSAKWDSMPSTALREKITDISAQYGNGKVVGTHLSSLTKGELVQWLDSWKNGDMPAVFALDAKGGKVSPAHPGAPGNAGTHHITWSPFDPYQAPASKDIPGQWTKLDYGIPQKEVHNYLIKMNFQHAEFLPSHLQEQAVRAHRNHDQDEVDALTRMATHNYEAGLPAHTAAPEWTDGLKPATPYDTYLTNSTPAENWNHLALKEFHAGHQQELAKYAQVVAEDTGYDLLSVQNSPGNYVTAKLVQAWLDDQHAKDVATQMVPVWKKSDSGALPSHGHTVWKATQTIPYTGQVSHWFAKPAPDGKDWRLEQEHAANQIGKMFGFKTAESQILSGEKAFGGVKVQLQRAIPGSPLGHHTDMPAWSDFTPEQVTEIAMEHLLDWVLANDDTSPNNMIKTPDGHIVGVDKGRSWANFKWDGLSGGKSMDSMTKLVYTKLYDAVRSHQLSKDVADKAYAAVIQRARKMAKVPDDKLRQLLEEAFANRPTWTTIKDRQHAIEEILNRKNNLPSAFKEMWGKVYDQAGFGGQPSDFGTGMPWGEVPHPQARYGMVVFNDKGQVFLREVKNHYGATAWTFAKGGQHPSESPMQAAIREGAEETKYEFTPVGYVPGQWKGNTSANYYYLATAKGAKFTPEKDNGETEQTKWVSLDEAKALIAQSESAEVRARDLGVLDTAAKQWGKGAGKYHSAALADPNGLSAALPDVPEARLPEALGGHKLFSGFSEPEFTDHVTSAKTHGVPAFFGGNDLRDMHVLVWQKPGTGGQVTTHGETFLQGDGYSKVIEWLKEHSGKANDPYGDKATTYPGSGMPGYAPTTSANRGGISKERDYYNSIIKVARSVTTHKVDGNYNMTKLADMETLAKELDQTITGADVIISNPKVGPEAVHQATNLKSMATHYLGLIDKVRKAKEGSYGFGEGDLPRWLPLDTAKDDTAAKDELSKLGMKVNFGASSSIGLGELDDNHVFKPSGSTHGYQGKWWTVELPGGEKIEIGDGDATGVPLVHHGRVRFSTPDHSSVSMERVREALQTMGLPLHDAEEHNFEQHYWRHILTNLDDRKDGHQGKQQEVWDSIKAQFAEHGLTWNFGAKGDNQHAGVINALATLDPAAESQVYRRAFAKLTSEAQVADWAERGGFIPHLKHFDPSAATVVGGKPDWYRFDLAHKVASLPPPIIQTSNKSKHAVRKVKGGGHYGLDALLRVVGAEGSSGMGNPDDTGGPAFVFTRIRQQGQVMWSPLTMARTQNYAFDDDSWGRWTYRKNQAAWDSDVWSKYTGSVNEHMISDALSLLDDLELVEAADSTQRNELVAWLKGHGITHIRFMPVEDRIVTSIDSSAKAKVKANWAAHPELLDPLREPGVHAGAVPETVPSPSPAPPAPASPPAPKDAKQFLDELLSNIGDAGDTSAAATVAEHGGAEYVKGAKIPAGWKIYYKNGAYATKSPDGNWYLANADGTFMSDIPAPKGGTVHEAIHEAMEKGVVSGDAKKVSLVNGKLVVR
jgi:8-oxo-dGTP pyrophosphatase MutT (NUDIX family)